MQGAASRGSARKAEQAWNQGMVLMRQGDNPGAAAQFALATQHDPSAADAWLGLHVTGTDQKAALDGMLRSSARFGALRSKYQSPFRSTFQIGHYVTFRLETSRDLWLAAMSAFLDDRRLDEAWKGLSTALLDCDETRFVCTRYAFLKEDWPLVLKFAPGIGDAFLRDEAQLYVGGALFAQGVCHESLNVLSALPGRLDAGSRFDAEVKYFMGRSLEALGREEEALKRYQYAFRCAPDLLDVESRAQARPVSKPAPAPAAPVAATAGGAPARSGSGGDGEGELSADERARVLAEAQRALDAMIGLQPVKRQVRTLLAQLRMSALREEQGLPGGARPRHFVFAGPPGTGKTTVARIIGQVFAGLGLLSSGHVVEAQRADLVGQHLGSTALKTNEVIDSALNGVLFIDEAYSLNITGLNGGDAFGKEAIQVLLKRAEDDRDRLVVVLAGYRDEMSELLATNPGLVSRFNTRVDFPSYSAEELVLIARSVLASQGDEPDAGALDVLNSLCAAIVDGGKADLVGNARFARELCAKASAQRDLRLFSAHADSTPTREEMVTILAWDLVAAHDELMESHRDVGTA
ncbi:AAA family ATPase [Streptomyces drozdowiczii]|uniref:AAA family ATPase n=1 Tax=Streptomyces drozdowiczii TaxID=202862 RepID=A0ABY6PNE4_9ACTN|nr:AAA family ATPase [Streptomyces drozdowiczii]MCX0247183.1 AAA family ATPase [Streptomyces drozdowiczii]UZK53389.1 AAA family ATPase [Streptomyces drozdowiczii]